MKMLNKYTVTKKVECIYPVSLPQAGYDEWLEY